MTIRVRHNPRVRIDALLSIEPDSTRTHVAERLGLTYWSARYWLELMVTEGSLQKSVVWTARGFARRITYSRVIIRPPPPRFYYRTQYAIMLYVEEPRTKTPDPIAEFRITAVSAYPDRFDTEEFQKACFYIGFALAPQTWWIKQGILVTADEKDEPVDPDEIELSIPVMKRLNYAERYAVFFRSRRDGKDWWRGTYPAWWLVPTEPLPAPRDGDYEYDENFIKKAEEELIRRGRMKQRFDNVEGRMKEV